MLKALDEAAKGQDRNLGSGDDETGKGETVSMEKHVFFLWCDVGGNNWRDYH